MIVHANRIRNTTEHPTQVVGNFRRAHPHAQLLRFGNFTAYGFHG